MWIYVNVHSLIKMSLCVWPYTTYIIHHDIHCADKFHRQAGKRYPVFTLVSQCHETGTCLLPTGELHIPSLSFLSKRSSGSFIRRETKSSSTTAMRRAGRIKCHILGKRESFHSVPLLASVWLCRLFAVNKLSCSPSPHAPSLPEKRVDKQRRNSNSKCATGWQRLLYDTKSNRASSILSVHAFSMVQLFLHCFSPHDA